MKITVGSRDSKLAVVQSEMVIKALEAQGGNTVELLTMKTTGDMILDKTLDQIGGKGLFVKELDKALVDKRADLTVHSLKDMPMEVSEELPLLAYSKREDPRDVLILPMGASEIDFSKPIGCSSKRRQLQLKKIMPEATIAPIRGNVQTRLRKLDSGEFSAIILAYAGIKRLGLEDRVSRIFGVEEILPAACQGILAVQGRKDFDRSVLMDFNDEETKLIALAERSYVRTLDGGCSSPVAAYGTIKDDEITLTGFYVDSKEKTYFDKITGNKFDGEKLGKELALRMKKSGKVFLVGAGPGDRELLTVKATELIGKADVIVYDRLVSKSIMSLIPENAELIDVGKNVGDHPVPQYRINEILLEKALENKMVVRLKGGDPFIFGRGGEELELLAENNIEFEVVPGITSSISVPAYAGIPVTHRDFCSSLHIITGHAKAGSQIDIDFEALVRLKGTLIFMMSVSTIGQIANGLMAANMDKKMPCAVIENGTYSEQRKFVSTIEHIEETVRKNSVKSPSVIVVGKVCSLSDKFDWFSKLPLKDKKIIVTQPQNKSSKLEKTLRQLGADTTLYPSIKTEFIRPLDIPLESYNTLIFTSSEGVKSFFSWLMEKGLDGRKLFDKKIGCIGSQTALELKNYGINADFIPKTFDGETLAKESIAEGFLTQSDKVLLLRAKIGTEDIVNVFDREKIEYLDVPVYETKYIKHHKIDNLCDYDYLTFTSKSCVDGFVKTQERDDFSGIDALCIGKQTAAEAKKYGFNTIISKVATIDSMIEEVIENAK